MKVFSRLFPAIAIDAGSSRVRIATQDEVIVDEPSFIAFNKKTAKVVAVGEEALSMRGRVAKHIVVTQPFQVGEVYDLHWAKQLLQIMLQKNTGFKKLLSPTFVYSVPASSSKAMHESYSKLFFSLGGNEVISVASPLAASVGAGVPIADSTGSFLLHVGEGTAEGVVISLGSVIAVERIDVGGADSQKRMQYFLKKNYHLETSLEKSEQLLRKLHVVSSPRSQQEILVPGKDMKNGNPQEMLIPEQTIGQEVVRLAEEYERLVRKLLSRIPTGLTTDVIDKGLLLSGGGALLPGLEQFLTQKLGVAVSTVDEPDLAVIKGLRIILDNLDEFKSSLGYISDVVGKRAEE